jgi:hypothetical protein
MPGGAGPTLAASHSKVYQLMEENKPFKRKDANGEPTGKINLLDFHQLELQPESFFTDLDIKKIMEMKVEDPVPKQHTSHLEQQIVSEITKDDTVKYMALPDQSELPRHMKHRQRQPDDEDSDLDPSEGRLLYQ